MKTSYEKWLAERGLSVSTIPSTCPSTHPSTHFSSPTNKKKLKTIKRRKKCKTCGTIHVLPPSKAKTFKFCNKECQENYKFKNYHFVKNTLDSAMSNLVRSRGVCDHCGRQGVTYDWSHVISRSNKTLRWDIFNALCLCFQCHKFFWHEQPLLAAEWFRSKYPSRYEYLLLAKNIIVKRTEEDYKNLYRAIINKDIDKLHLSWEEVKHHLEESTIK